MEPETMGPLTSILVSSVTSATVSGVFLIAAYLVKGRIEQTAKHENIWKNIGPQIVTSADELVAKMFALFLRNPEHAMSKKINFEEISALAPSEQITTIYRLIKYFASVRYLERELACIPTDPNIGLLKFYSINKTRMSLKGNLFKPGEGLPTEVQQYIGELLLRFHESRDIRYVNYTSFVENLKEVKVREVVERIQMLLAGC